MANDPLAEAPRQWTAAQNGARCRLLSLFLGGLILLPTQARDDGEIPFTVTNRSNEDACVLCTGPWFRDSDAVVVPQGATNFPIYSAEINLFSPIGLWNCVLGGAIGSKCGFSLVPPHATFCVFVDPDRITPVMLTLGNDNSIGVYFPPPPCNSSMAAAFLGDAASAGQRDRDVFRFDGVAGDTITVRLERDGARGSSGKIAKLSLDAAAGGTLREKEGAVPLEFKVSLPSTGHFALAATEVQDAAYGFRGYFRLSVTSARGAQPLLKPAEATEP